MGSLEIASNILNLISVLLARRNNAWTWPVGIVGCILFGVLFYQVKLYADVSLQVFFVLTSAYGLWKWKRGGEQKTDLPITRLKARVFLALLALAGISTGLYGAALHYWTDASFPFVDSVVLMLSILAQFLLMARKIENWWVWMVVNIVAVPLYASKALYLTSGIYAVFLANAVWGWFTWRKLMNTQA